jgi:hypothetical protein
VIGIVPFPPWQWLALLGAVPVLVIVDEVRELIHR